jgi:hypothetical protein
MLLGFDSVSVVLANPVCATNYSLLILINPILLYNKYFLLPSFVFGCIYC